VAPRRGVWQPGTTPAWAGPRLIPRAAPTPEAPCARRSLPKSSLHAPPAQARRSPHPQRRRGCCGQAPWTPPPPRSPRPNTAKSTAPRAPAPLPCVYHQPFLLPSHVGRRFHARATALAALCTLYSPQVCSSRLCLPRPTPTMCSAPPLTLFRNPIYNAPPAAALPSLPALRSTKVGDRPGAGAGVAANACPPPCHAASAHGIPSRAPVSHQAKQRVPSHAGALKAIRRVHSTPLPPSAPGHQAPHRNLSPASRDPPPFPKPRPPAGHKRPGQAGATARGPCLPWPWAAAVCVA
jgi:hypothetical protein